MRSLPGTRRSWWWSAVSPTVGVHLAPDRVSAVALVRRRDGYVIAKYADEPLPEGAIAPLLNETNIAAPDLVTEALTRTLQALGVRSKRVGLVVPDSLAKVSLVRFEQVPTRSADLDQLVRWRVRKSAPFRIEDAQVAYTPGITLPEGGRELVVTIARRDIIEEYERVCAAAGAHAGVVDLTTFGLINVVLAASTHGRADAGRPRTSGGQGPEMARALERAQSGYSIGDWLVVHVSTQYSSVAIVRGEDLVFFRNRRADVEGNLADLVHQTTMYYEDRLEGSGFSRVVLAGAASSAGPAAQDDAAQLRRGLEMRLNRPVEVIDPTRAAAFRDDVMTTPDVLDTLAAPIGLLLRDRAPA